MQSMIDFSAALLGVLADWLVSVPIIYFVGMFLLLFVVKAFKILINGR